MEPFNLEEYLKDSSRKVVTRDGRNVRIICTDKRGTQIFQLLHLLNVKIKKKLVIIHQKAVGIYMRKKVILTFSSLPKRLKDG